MFTLPLSSPPRLSLRKAFKVSPALGLAALLSLVAAPVRASSWVLDHYETSVTASGNGNPPTYPSSTTDAGVGAAYGGIGTSLSGTITPVFRCTDNTGDTTLYVKITVGASASQLYGSNDAAASDGMGDPSVPGYRGYPPYVAGYSSNGVHLVQKQAPGSVQIGTLVRLSPITVSANGVSETIGLKAVPDSRGVTIGSSLGQTYSKGANNVPQSNVRASDGSITDDTVVPDPVAGTPVTYSPSYSGSWGNDSNYKWACSLTSYGSSGVFNSSSLFGNKTIPSFSGVYNSPPATAGKSDTVTLTLTDGSDGSTGSNTATVRFHDPTENWALWNTAPSYWEGATTDNVASPGYAAHNSGITATWEYTDTVWAQAASAFTSVGGNMMPNPYWAGLCAAASIAFSKVQPQQIQQTVNFNDAWGDSNSTFNPQPIDNSTDTMELYKMVPELYVQYQPQTWRADTYGASGYTGVAETTFAKFQRWDTAGDFTYVRTDPTGGH